MPSANTALPIPVPSVTTTTLPAWPLPAPNRISARPAASASFITVTSRPSAAPNSCDGVDADPRGVDVGRGLHDPGAHHRRHRDPDRPGRVEAAPTTSATTVATPRPGVAGDGVRIRTRSAANAPRGHVDRRPLDPGAADVDADGGGGS